VQRSPLLLCLAAAVALGGCQATDTDDPPETSHGLKVEHALGTTKVPGQSTRPVVLYPSELDDAFALEASPVGAAGVLPRYLSPRTRQTKIVGTIWHPNLSRISALHPDLILGGKQSQRGYYRRLTKIAPTVVIDQKVNWKPNLRQDGEALGHSDFAEKLLSEYDFLAARTRSVIRRHGQPKFPAAVRPALTRPFVASILDDVGVKHPVPRKDLLAGARPGRYDAWTLGMGYIAATRILADLQRFSAG
jgi:ABC-type Fe3+-hydroxamate transport system substrate-binding protein